ncbi:MAG: sodium:solute symporter [Rhodothermaceae bacterium]
MNLESIDYIFILLFFGIIYLTSYFAGKKQSGKTDDYLLSGRNVGLFLFVLTNVSTWYGGILGVGEFTYSYGIASWFTQGFPYYIFAAVFAFLMAGKIRKAQLYTIPEKLTQTYGEKTGKLASLLILLLVSPAPYLLMAANIIALIIDVHIFYAILFISFISFIYLYKGGFKADLYTDAIEFFFMFAGFIAIVVFAYFNLGGLEYLENNLPETHLDPTGGTSPAFMLVWFLIALWTFADPGFHQRCYSAKNAKVAKYGILISIFFWALFDFLTTSTGLFARAAIPSIETPVNAYPLLAEKLLPAGVKGLFYIALFSTIFSTLNSFLFLSSVTIGKDLLKSVKKSDVKKTKMGLLITVVTAGIISLYFDSVIAIWYTIGSICIPPLILLVFGSYFPKLETLPKFAIAEVIAGVSAGTLWFIIKDQFTNEILLTIEPMLVGLFISGAIHFTGIILKRKQITNK